MHLALQQLCSTVKAKDGPHEFSISLASLDSCSYLRRILTVWSKRVGLPGPDGYFGVFGGFFGFSSRVYVHHQAMPSRPEGEEVFVSSERRDASGIGALLRSSRLQNNHGKPALFHIQTKSPAAAGL